MRLPRVLIVEGEMDVAALIKRTLEEPGEIDAEIVGTVEAALETVVKSPPDLIVLDLNVPPSSGAGIWRALRSRMNGREVPIVVLSARASHEDRGVALDLGADDCLTKPFSVRELRARVKAILRRGAADLDGTGAVSVYRSARLSADFETMSVVADGRNVRLTKLETELLRYLIAHRNRLVPRGHLLENVWGQEAPARVRSVDVRIGRLRMKLGQAGRQIQTVIGLGYRFVDEPGAGWE